MSIGIWFLVPESLDPQNRKSMILTQYNPFRPLFHIRENPVVLWIAVVQFAISLPETGVIDTMIIYVLDQLDINSEAKSSEISALMIAFCGIGMIIGNIVLLPLLKRRYTDYRIILIAAVCLVSSMLLLALVSVIKHLVIVILGCLMLTTGMIAFPAANSIVTRHASKTEQGIAFGIVYAMRGITFMIAPFSFGYGYTLCKWMNAPYLIYIIAALLCSLVVPCIMGPLKKTLEDTKKYHRKYNFSVANLDEARIISQNIRGGDTGSSATASMTPMNMNMDEISNKEKDKMDDNTSGVMYEMVSVVDSVSERDDESETVGKHGL